MHCSKVDWKLALHWSNSFIIFNWGSFLVYFGLNRTNGSLFKVKYKYQIIFILLLYSVYRISLILISSSCKCPKVLAIASFHMSLESKHSAVKTPFAGIFEYLKWIHIFSKTMPQMKTILRYMYQGMYFSETTKPYLEEILFFQQDQNIRRNF